MLRPEVLDRHVRRETAPSGVLLDRWVETYWTLAWDLPPDLHFTSSVIPHPACSLTVERGTALRPEVRRLAGAGSQTGQVVVTGIPTRRFDVDIHGSGWVFGVKFRPGGLAALVDGNAREWTDRTVPAASVVSKQVCEGLSELDPAGSMDEWMSRCEAQLHTLPAVVEQANDETYQRVLTIVADMLDDRDLVRVAEVQQRYGVSGRTLDRWFRRYVGVGPKWVLARYRMHDVVAQIDADLAADVDGESLTELAHRFGWFDQAHFTRDFVRLVGVTPGQYRDRPL